MFSSYRNIMARKAAGEMDETGFTLIELLIVIVVLGILAGVVIFALGGVTGQSAIASCKADGATLTTAMAAYNAQNGANPQADSDLVGNGVQSWPSNFGHYAFGLVSGVLYVETGQTTAIATAWSASPTASGAGVAAYTGVSSCSSVL